MVYSVHTREYPADIGKLLHRRLKEVGLSVRLHSDKDLVSADVRTQDFPAWCKAISRLLTQDLSHFELARMVNNLPLSLQEKQEILPELLKEIRSCGNYGLEYDVLACFQNDPRLNLEGFMRFRMQEILSNWALCVDHAVQELMLKAEYCDLMEFIGTFVSLQIPRIKEVSLCLNPDGSCTLVDEGEIRIDYSSCPDGMVGILIGLAPEKILVYDLSDGQHKRLSATLQDVFADKVSFFN